MKNSEYPCKEARGHVVDGIRGWKNKIERRKREQQDFYRLAKNTLQARVKKKLMEKETWYRTEKNRDEDKPEDWELPDGWKVEKKRGEKRKADSTTAGEKRGKKRIKGVMFIPHTHHSELAGDMRTSENHFEEVTDFRVKMVEKAGIKVGSLLTENDPWSGQDCSRESCWLCDTKLATGKLMNQDCTRRNLVYETYCMSCEENERERNEKEEDKDKSNEKGKVEVKLYKYI